jgi:hypothetical protein
MTAQSMPNSPPNSTPASGDSPTHDAPAPRQRTFRFWFGCGFVVVFVLMFFVGPLFAVHPSGRIVRCRLWQYYIYELPRAVGSPFGMQTAGATMGSESAVFVVAAEHVAAAGVGGVVLAPLVWGVQRFTRRR